MDSLFALFNPLVALLNRRIGESTPARELAGKLDGCTIGIRLKSTGLGVAISVADERLVLATLDDIEPDAALSGSLLSLAQLAGDDSEALVRDGRVELAGDAVVADDFRALLRHGRPDWEEELSRVVGDVAAHGIGDVVRNVGRWGRDARATFRQNVGEYLQEESRSVPSRYEIEEFATAVQALRDDVARVEARIALLEKKTGSGD